MEIGTASLALPHLSMLTIITLPSQSGYNKHNYWWRPIFSKEELVSFRCTIVAIKTEMLILWWTGNNNVHPKIHQMQTRPVVCLSRVQLGYCSSVYAMIYNKPNKQCSPEWHFQGFQQLVDLFMEASFSNSWVQKYMDCNAANLIINNSNFGLSMGFPHYFLFKPSSINVYIYILFQLPCLW